MNIDAKVLLDEAALMALQIRFLEKRIAELVGTVTTESHKDYYGTNAPISET